jgi:Uma2 family endonuclease
MSTPVQARLMTAEELLDMPDDGFRYELVRGELKKMSPPGEEHGILVARVTTSLYNHVDAHGLGIIYAGEPGFKLSVSPDTVRAPDVAFISQERLDKLPPGKGYRPEAPDLAVEIISPSDRYAEVEEKVVGWLDAGTRMVLVLNPRSRTAKSYRSPKELRFLGELPQLRLAGANRRAIVLPGPALQLHADGA